MPKGGFMEQWWERCLLAIAILFLCQMYIVFSRVQTLDEDKLTLTAEVEMLRRKQDEMRMNLLAKERDLVRLTRKGDKIEQQIRDQVRLLGPGRKNEPVIYFITPTHFRPGQKADLTRLSYTLSHVPDLHWIVVEDSYEPSDAVQRIIKRSNLPYTHIHAKTRKDMKLNYTDPNWALPRGVEQRNAALGWIRKQLSEMKNGAVYFGDDDNVYDLRLFNEIRSISRIGIWPVGIVGGLIVETPHLADNGSVVGFNALWKPERPFPVDMAAFAVNLTLVLNKPEAGFKYSVPRGYQESQFLTSLGVGRGNLEPMAQRCSKVYVWHTRTEKPKLTKSDWARVATGTTELDASNFSDLEREALGIDLKKENDPEY